MRNRKAWLGGYVRQGARGPVYVIERWIAGVHWHVSTRCRTERAALAHLAAFEASPETYDPRAVGEAPAGLYMTADLILENLEWRTTSGGNSPAHAASAGTYLRAWLVALHGRDLRTLRAHELREHLAKWPTAKRYRVIALKGFFRWLRVERGLLTHSQDPTLDLAVPPARPAKLKRRKVVESERVEAALSKLKGRALDVLRVLAATGMHYSEISRFARGEGELFRPTPEQLRAGVVSNLAIKHKSGDLHVVALLDPEALAAAQRIRAAGRVVSRNWLHRELKRAAEAAGVEPFPPGVLRHSVATWLAQDGVPLAQIADLLGHRSPVTTAKFYRDLGGLAPALPVRRLKLAEP